MKIVEESRNIKDVLLINTFMNLCKQYAMDFDSSMDLGLAKNKVEEVVKVYQEFSKDITSRLRAAMKEKEGGYSDLTVFHADELRDSVDAELEKAYLNEEGKDKLFEVPVIYFTREEVKKWNKDFGDKDKYKEKAFNPNPDFFTIGASFIIDKVSE